MTTVVTAFYQFDKSKHSIGEYTQWIDNFFKCVTSPVVCFCDNVHYLQRYKTDRVTFIARPFDSFELTSPDWVARWQREWNRDPERDIHSWQLYAVWALKQEFVNIAIQQNIYNSHHFVWCDIGCFREPSNFVNPPRFAETTPSHVPPGHMLILEIHETNGYTYIGGGVLAGDVNAWRGFRDSYLNTLNRFFERSIFYGKDQTIYKYMIDRNSIPFHIVTTDGEWGRGIKSRKFGSRWFYLTHLLSV